ncbi:Gfo/Idh/MocA family oxidoreductase [Nonomuraea endophytica]|uniref:Thiazolinyl imide reductase n=1 Tax=Nonomuraea endophytica TaxID=714136 RepID=A0A7W8A4S3_9ACTN|nr:Gfo/Idh/MocA family oxidoreductase [Nonomuraea endophytica]MBB5078726.1 thiazolinyl imide reductase [Nonomuraea endophytica]
MKRIVVCGTTFGQVYLDALREGPFELTGILAKGSARSAARAREHGVPLLTRPDQVPEVADAACVVVRSGVVGGDGTELTAALLEHGVHVLQEHPVHPDELARVLRTARSAGAVHHLNTLYPHLEPVRRFIEAARRLRALQQPLYVDAACSVHVAYALLDILGQALGSPRPWSFASAAPGAPFTGVSGSFGGVPLTLRVQNQIAPNDPDAHLHLLHRITLGAEGGSLTLVNTHGPLVWSPRMYVGREDDGRFATGGPGLELPSATVLGPAEAPAFRDIVTRLWPEGVRRALTGLHDAVTGGGDPLSQGQYHLALGRAWLDLTRTIGRPDLLTQEPPRPLAAEEIA